MNNREVLFSNPGSDADVIPLGTTPSVPCAPSWPTSESQESSALSLSAKDDVYGSNDGVYSGSNTSAPVEQGTNTFYQNF
jgi:hypothetical protein